MLIHSLTKLHALALRFPAWSAVNNPQIVAYYEPRSLRRELAKSHFTIREMVTGRYRFKYFTAMPLATALWRGMDSAFQRFEVGTMLAIAQNSRQV